MQQEYTPYGPEWAKEIKKLTKDQIIDNLLRPALMKAKAEPAGQSAGTWVSCSDRFPDDWQSKHMRYVQDHYKVDTDLFEHIPWEKSLCKIGGTGRLKYAEVEWLDESALPVNKDREEQAEWEFVQILKENYEAAKRSDEYHFAGKTKKGAVVETYEDLFEIIKGLPLKRQKVDFSFANNKEEKSEPYYGMTCPHCGAQTNVDPALVKDDDPMPYCPECDEPLFDDKNETA